MTSDDTEDLTELFSSSILGLTDSSVAEFIRQPEQEDPAGELTLEEIYQAERAVRELEQGSGTDQ